MVSTRPLFGGGWGDLATRLSMLITSHLLTKQKWHKQTLPRGGRASVCNYNWAHLLHVLSMVLPILCSDSRNRLTTVVAEQVQPTQWLPDQCLLYDTWKASSCDLEGEIFILEGGHLQTPLKRCNLHASILHQNFSISPSKFLHAFAMSP